jgi:hypothetical protein
MDKRKEVLLIGMSFPLFGILGIGILISFLFVLRLVCGVRLIVATLYDFVLN